MSSTGVYCSINKREGRKKVGYQFAIVCQSKGEKVEKSQKVVPQKSEKVMIYFTLRAESFAIKVGETNKKPVLIGLVVGHSP